LKVTVCELPNQPDRLSEGWQHLAAHTRSVESDLVLLPEMPFSPWLAASRQVDRQRWHQAVNSHRLWMERFPELGVATVVGTRPTIHDGQPYNEGFVWSSDSGAIATHIKYYLPDEAGFWEASWYRRGNKSFEAVTRGGIVCGFLICTELWFTGHAREYARQGAHLIVCPRATPASSTDKWIAGGRTAAVMAGAFCLSSNLIGPNIPGTDFGGTGWIIEPEEGTVLGTTTADEPFFTMDIDPRWAEAAKKTYPRYVAD
jgi:N-carbamoylputrescine amidase